MGQDAVPSNRRKRLGKAERAAAQQKHAAQQQPLPDACTNVHFIEQKPVTPYTNTEGRTGRHLFALLTESIDGVLKICPTENPLVCYLYWRWSRGRWAGYYLCSLCSLYELSSGLAQLASKIDDVRIGSRKPTKDRYQG